VVERLFGLCAMEPRWDKIPGKNPLRNFLRGKIPEKSATTRSVAVIALSWRAHLG